MPMCAAMWLLPYSHLCFHMYSHVFPWSHRLPVRGSGGTWCQEWSSGPTLASVRCCSWCPHQGKGGVTAARAGPGQAVEGVDHRTTQSSLGKPLGCCTQSSPWLHQGASPGRFSSASNKRDNVLIALERVWSPTLHAVTVTASTLSCDCHRVYIPFNDLDRVQVL